MTASRVIDLEWGTPRLEKQVPEEVFTQSEDVKAPLAWCGGAEQAISVLATRVRRAKELFLRRLAARIRGAGLTVSRGPPGRRRFGLRRWRQPEASSTDSV